MQQSELPLYPKLSSIYNKIMQLAIAIIIIVVLMEVWLFTSKAMEASIEQNFRQVNRDYIEQLSRGVEALLPGKRENIQSFIENSAKPEWVKDISFYGVTGQTLFSSEQQESIRDLYGINQFQLNVSDKFVPFIHEVRTDELKGYLRLTVEREYFTGSLSQANYQHYDLLRVMMMLAGLVGFLLTRGLNRFSRQGYRLNKSIKQQAAKHYSVKSQTAD